MSRAVIRTLKAACVPMFTLLTMAYIDSLITGSSKGYLRMTHPDQCLNACVPMLHMLLVWACCATRVACVRIGHRRLPVTAQSHLQSPGRTYI